MKMILSVLTLCIALTSPARAWMDGPPVPTETKALDADAMIRVKAQHAERLVSQEQNTRALTAFFETRHTQLTDPVFKCASRENAMDGFFKLGSNIMVARDGTTHCVQTQRRSADDVMAESVATILKPGDMPETYTRKEIADALKRLKNKLKSERLEKANQKAEDMKIQLMLP